MKNRHKAMTLLEVMISVAILAIFMALASNTFLKNIFSAGDDFSARADLRQGVSTTLENVQNQIKNSTQVHLVDKTVFDPKLDIDEMNRRLDKRYKYISLGNDGESTICDIEYKKDSSGSGTFERLPIISSTSNDMLKSRDIKYKIELYKNDDNYKEKMEKKIINITVTGILNGGKKFSMSKDVTLSNVNQIMFSRFFTGNRNDITAIAYDKFAIKAETEKAKSKATVVLALDNSGSMTQNLNGNIITKVGLTFYRVDGYKVKDGEKIRNSRDPYRNTYWGSKKLLEGVDCPRKYIAGEAANKNFLESLSAIAKKDDIDMNVYIFNFDEDVTYSRKNTDRNEKYLYPLDTLTKNRYGPYNLKNDRELEKAKNRVKKDCRMNFIPSEMTGELYGMTNVGEAILQSLEILNQEDEKNSDQQKFFVLMTDGEPSTCTNIGRKWDYKFLSSKQVYNENSGFRGGIFQIDDKNKAMEYVKDVTDPKHGLNVGDIYNKAYIIGFSGLNSEKSKQDEIKDSLGRSGNEVDVYDTKDGIELSNAFENISQNIGDIISVFEGPKKLKV